MSPERLYSKEYLYWLLQKVSVDHDNTICDTKGLIVERFNQEFGTNHQAIEIARWHSLADWAKELGMTDKEAQAVDQRYWFDKDLVNLARPNPGAIEFLQEVNKIGELVINSSRPYEQLALTVSWYKQYAPFIKPEQIVVGLPDIVVPGDIVAQAVSKVWVVKIFGSRSHVDDVNFHMKFILDHTDAFGFLLSDDASLDVPYRGRLMRFGGDNGNPPNMTQMAKLVASYVAQSH